MEHPISVEYLRWIVLLPLLGAAVNGLGGAAIQRTFGKRAISIIACTPVVIAFVISVCAFSARRSEPRSRGAEAYIALAKEFLSRAKG